METPSINPSNPSYFRPSEMISRLRATVRMVGWRSPRTAFSSGESGTSRVSLSVSGVARRGSPVVGGWGAISASDYRLVTGQGEPCHESNRPVLVGGSRPFFHSSRNPLLFGCYGRFNSLIFRKIRLFRQVTNLIRKLL